MVAGMLTDLDPRDRSDITNLRAERRHGSSARRVAYRPHRRARAAWRAALRGLPLDG